MKWPWVSRKRADNTLRCYKLLSECWQILALGERDLTDRLRAALEEEREAQARCCEKEVDA